MPTPRGFDSVRRLAEVVPDDRRTSQTVDAAPALLTGMACCIPTFTLVAGGGVAAALMPAVLPLRAVFYPLSLVLLGMTLVWAVARAP